MEDFFMDIQPYENFPDIYIDSNNFDFKSEKSLCNDQIFSICPTDFGLDIISSKCIGNCLECHDGSDPFMLTDANPMWSQNDWIPQIIVIQSSINKAPLENQSPQQSLLKARLKSGLHKFQHSVSQPNVQMPLPMCQALVNPQDVCPLITESKRINLLAQSQSCFSSDNGNCYEKENKKFVKSTCSSYSDYGSETSEDQLDYKFFEDHLSKTNSESELIELWPSESSGSDEEKYIDIENFEYNNRSALQQTQKCRVKANKKIKTNSKLPQYEKFASKKIKVEPSFSQKLENHNKKKIKKEELDFNFEKVDVQVKVEPLSPDYLINEMHNYVAGPLKNIQYISHSAPHSPNHRPTKCSKKNSSGSNPSSPSILSKKSRKLAFKIPKNHRHNNYQTLRNGLHWLEDMGEERLRRAQHNVLERKRRSNLKDLFIGLQEIVPEMKGNHRFSKVSILKQATMHINNTQQEVESLSKNLRKLEDTNKYLKNLLCKIADN